MVREYLERYKGKLLEDIFKGIEIENEFGRCYLIENRYDVKLANYSPERVHRRFITDLKLIREIRRSTERMLKSQGYRTIDKLLNHPHYCLYARDFLEVYYRRNTYELQRIVERRFSKSHPLSLFLSGFHEKTDFLFFDIETMGLSTFNPVILIGVARFENGALSVKQFLARDIDEEKSILFEFMKMITDKSAFVTFNGKKFDVPFIAERLRYHGLCYDLRRANFDLLLFSRRVWRGKLPNCRLLTIEKHVLGINREEDVDSYLVPYFYREYLRHKNPGPLVPLIEHNRQDVLSLSLLFSKLIELIK